MATKFVGDEAEAAAVLAWMKKQAADAPPRTPPAQPEPEPRPGAA